LIHGVSSGKTVVNCATLQEDDMTEGSKQVTSRGGIFFEAPVLGSKARLLWSTSKQYRLT
jgi:3-hydroxyisobutyrate dehydrogenase-like beta-hydroxyacid dehydrogenase